MNRLEYFKNVQNAQANSNQGPKVQINTEQLIQQVQSNTNLNDSFLDRLIEDLESNSHNTTHLDHPQTSTNYSLRSESYDHPQTSSNDTPHSEPILSNKRPRTKRGREFLDLMNSADDSQQSIDDGMGIMTRQMNYQLAPIHEMNKRKRIEREQFQNAVDIECEK